MNTPTSQPIYTSANAVWQLATLMLSSIGIIYFHIESMISLGTDIIPGYGLFLTEESKEAFMNNCRLLGEFFGCIITWNIVIIGILYWTFCLEPTNISLSIVKKIRQSIGVIVMHLPTTYCMSCDCRSVTFIESGTVTLVVLAGVTWIGWWITASGCQE